MKIPEEYLKESNYEGTRLIPITDERVIKLSKEIAKLKEPAAPHLKRMEELSQKTDPVYAQIQTLQGEINRLRESITKEKEEFDAELVHLEKIDSKAQLIKNKMTPMVNDILEGQLSEFERPVQVITKDDGTMWVEVRDEVEEKIKQLRATKKNG